MLSLGLGSAAVTPLPSRREPGGMAAGALVMLLWLALGSGPAPAADDPAAAPARDLERVEQRMRALEAELAARQAERASLGDELERSDRDIADLARAGRESGQLLAEQRRVIADLDRRLGAGRERLALEQAGLARLVRATYATGRGGGVRLLLDRNDLHRTDRVLAYYGYLSRERGRRLAEVAAQTRDLEGLALDAAEEAERLARLVAQQEDLRQRLVVAREGRTALLAELDRDIAGGRVGMAALAADAQGLREVIEQLARAAQIAAEADLQPVPLAERRGKLPWPLARVVLLAQFSGPRGGEGQRWDGVLLAAEEGAEVRAIHQGRVVYADWLRGFGLLAVIDHGDGYLSLYGHNQTLLKEVGEWVGTGDPIALSGSSGGQDTGQLYFALRHRGQPQDPRVWCGPTGS